MQIFTDTVPASEDIAPFAIGLAQDEEIKELYSDWEILQFKSYVFAIIKQSHFCGCSTSHKWVKNNISLVAPRNNMVLC